MKKLYFLFNFILISSFSQAQVVISQAYGGGGNVGATYSNDFIELFNRGTTAQSLAGWSVQYASANGTSWTTTALPSVTLQPGQYFLIQQAAGSTPVLALPTPDLDGMSSATTGSNGNPLLTGIAMSGSNGKLILVNTTVAETTANPTGPQIIDKVAYGTTSTSGFEGSGPTGVALTNSTAAIRNNSGCTDANDNATDFTAATPTPRNTASPVNICSTASVNDNAIAGLKIYPNPSKGNTLYIASDLIGNKSVVIFDVLGKQIISNSNVTDNGINIGSLKAGIYMVNVTQDGKSATRKLVVQ